MILKEFVLNFPRTSEPGTIPFLGWGQTGDSCYSDISMVLQEVEVSIVSDAVCEAASSTSAQGGRTWQPFVGGKNGHENFRQARI